MSSPPDPARESVAAPDAHGAASARRQQQHVEAQRQIQRHSAASMASGLIPLPLVDLAAVFTIQLKLLHSLARVYEVAFRADLGRSAIASLISSALPMAAGVRLGASLAKPVPALGQTVATGTLVLLNGAITYAIGQVFVQHFATGGTLLTFDPEAMRDYFAEQLDVGGTEVAKLRRHGKPSRAGRKRAARGT